MNRSRGTERLELADQDPELLARSLRHVGQVNRFLGGFRALRLHLREHAEPRPGGEASERRKGRSRAGRSRDPEGNPVRVLDVGAGDAETLLHLREWAPDDWRFVGVELSPKIAALARDRSRSRERLAILRGDGLSLPFPDSSFHVVLCTLTLHHFSDEAAVRLVREMARVASERVLVNDLERSFLHYLGSLLLAATVWIRDPITRHDGPLSVRRSFTPGEMERIAEAAGLLEPSVHRRMLFRLVLEGRPGPSGVHHE